jgi:predicted nucleic acid-binding protein
VTNSIPLLVLDSFALLAFFRDEPVADDVENLLHRGLRGEVRLAMTVANLGEVVYRTVREHGFERAQEVLGRIEEYDIDMVDVDRELAVVAAYLKGTRRVAYADCLAAALAQRLDAAVVTGDPDFAQLEDAVRIEWLSTSERQ